LSSRGRGHVKRDNIDISNISCSTYRIHSPLNDSFQSKPCRLRIASNNTFKNQVVRANLSDSVQGQGQQNSRKKSIGSAFALCGRAKEQQKQKERFVIPDALGTEASVASVDRTQYLQI
jgi:hypothetical protein